MKKKIFICTLGLLLSIQFVLPTIITAKEKTAPVLNLRDIKGKQISSKELLTKGPVLVWFWNSCCGIKKKQVESLKVTYNAYKDKGLQIIAISEDGVKKTAKTKQAVNVYKMPFIVVMDKSKNLLGQFQAFAVPSLYLINKQGKIVFTHSGYMPGDEKKLDAALVTLFQKEEKEEKKEESTEEKEG
jgi:peroxiredoxin